MKLFKNKSFWFIILAIFFITSQVYLFASSSTVLNNEEMTISEIKDIVASSDSAKSKIANIKSAIKYDNYFWYFIGFLGEALFGSRMFVQWIASEKAKKNVIPVSFWYLSLSGSTLVFSYAIQLGDPVFILSKGAGFFIYIRNIILLLKEKKD